MSSRGPQIAGTDGTDFKHRQTVASHYQMSVINKSRLSKCLMFQVLLFLLMVVKLADDILDRMEIFVLWLQELYIPKPRPWEYIWAVSFMFSILASQAMRRNSVNLMSIYMGMLAFFSFGSVIWGSFIYFPDCWAYYQTRSLHRVSETWNGYPTAAFWCVFLFLCLQVHILQLVFSYKLKTAWQHRGRAKKSN